MLSALIIDDEAPARDELRALLSEEQDIEILGECANAIEGLSAIHRLRPDVVFLDIQMPRVVFLTAFNEYALQAFDQNAFDYLLKPVDPARLALTLKRLRHDRTPSPALFNSAAPLKQIPSPGHHRVLLIKIDDIEYATSKTTGVYVTTSQGAEHFTELTLRTLEEKTPFLRCHRQYLVNPEQIKELSFLEAGTVEIVTRNNHRIPVSRRLLGELKEKLGLL